MNNRIVLRDLFTKFNFNYNDIPFKHKRDSIVPVYKDPTTYNRLFTKHIIIGYNSNKSLICDWKLNYTEFETEQESIFKDPINSCGWGHVEDILDVNVELNSFIDMTGKPIELGVIALELWNKLISVNTECAPKNVCDDCKDVIFFNFWNN
jgi:hypothetical protein